MGVFRFGFVIVIIGFFFFFPYDSLSSELESEEDDEDEELDEEEEGGSSPPLLPQTLLPPQDRPIRRKSNQEGSLQMVPSWQRGVEHVAGYHSPRRDAVLEAEVAHHIQAVPTIPLQCEMDC